MLRTKIGIRVCVNRVRKAAKPNLRCRPVDPNRKQAVIAIVAAILARKLSSVPPNSPAAVAAIADAVSDAKRIVDRVEKSF
jgi:polyribonucleotide nucleotidyltransferase